MDITIVVPVRLGSTRCINKNLRPFAGTSLFDLKLDQLKPLKDKVVVSSSASEVLQHANGSEVDSGVLDEAANGQKLLP